MPALIALYVVVPRSSLSLGNRERRDAGTIERSHQSLINFLPSQLYNIARRTFAFWRNHNSVLCWHSNPPLSHPLFTFSRSHSLPLSFYPILISLFLYISSSFFPPSPYYDFSIPLFAKNGVPPFSFFQAN